MAAPVAKRGWAKISAKCPVWANAAIAQAESCGTEGIQEALDRLEATGSSNSAAFEQLIRRCATARALEEGRRLHSFMDRGKIDRPRFLGNLLVEMYGKCGSLDDAKRVFDAMQQRNVFTWTILMNAYVQNGHGLEALQLFQRMWLEGEQPDRVALVTAIDTCGTVGALAEGRGIHALFAGTEFESDLIVGNTLLSMYGKCQRLDEAKSVFDGMKKRDVISWNAMIAAYAQNGHNKEALDLYDEMEEKGFKPDRITFISTLDACAGLGGTSTLAKGKHIHSRISDCRLDVDAALATTLVNMYGKCGSLRDAKAAFSKITRRDMIAWNTMMNICVQSGHARDAIKLFQEMDLSGVIPNNITFVAALDACSSLEVLAEGRHVHSDATACGFESDLVTANALVNMYGKCGSVDDAKLVFDRMPVRNVISWTTMITAYARQGLAHEALQFFKQMQNEGMELDRITYVSVLDAYTSLGALEEGKAIHVRIVRYGLDLSLVVGNTLVNMYGKCGSPEDAKDVFDNMVEKDVVTWNAMLAAYAQNGKCKDALELFDEMQFAPDKVTFVTVLDACAGAAAVARGKWIHASINASEHKKDAAIGNALVHMYGKCGNLQEARRVFDNMGGRNVISWTSMMTAYAQNGLVKESLALVEQMDLEGIRPNDITFVTILFSCSHAGKPKDGRKYFLSMRQDHGIIPKAAHYGCLVDLLGRSGRLAEAEELITSMPFPADAVPWTSLLGACITHSDEDRGARAAEHVIKLEPRNAAPYVMLSNLYAALEKWDEAAKVRNRMDRIGAKKQAGSSWIEVDNKVHEFIAGDSVHPQKILIYDELSRLNTEMRIKGYQPDRKVVLHNLEEEEKDELLYYHSEKLAIAFGIVATPPRTPIRVVKNLRVCSDCHSAIKLISVLADRQIIVRDGNRFHHFDNGVCSCGDYW